MSFYEQILGLHIAAGTVALVTFWTAAALRKGSPRHMRIGQIYLLAMVVVGISALGLAYGAFSRQQPVRGAFLLYLVLITATPSWLAWRAVRDKHRIARYTGVVFRALAWINLAASSVVLALGVRYEVLLLMGLSAVGFFAGYGMLKFASRPPADRRWWLIEHYSSILGCGVATHIAFLNLGLSRLLPSSFTGFAQLIGWTAPFAVAFAAGFWLNRRYGPRAPATRVNDPVLN